MKRIETKLFSNGTDFMVWVDRNCQNCVKHSRYNEKKDTYSRFVCSIDADIQMQAASIVEDANLKSVNATKMDICQYLKTERKVKIHRPIKNQLTIFL